jgi:hypothetical protein
MDIRRTQSQLTPIPTRFPDCCLGLSSTLIKTLSALLPQSPKFTLSIGSGSGLLESLLSNDDAGITVQGVEVDSSVNRYIAEEDMHVVGGGWGLCSEAGRAAAWMFVYPRDPKLITRYLDSHLCGSVEMVLWLGPKVDWVDYEDRLRRSSFSELTILDEGECGLTPYETAVVARRS